jgi:hypothetical protein
VLQSNVKFASLRKQALIYGDIPDDDPIDYHDVDVGQGSPEELADAIEGLLTSDEQAGMSRDGVQSLRQLVCSAARTNVVFTNSHVDNNSSLISE